MQLNIELISIGAAQTVPTKNGKSYQAIEVAYKKDGKIEGKKIMSFASPSVFKDIQKFSQGDFVTVDTEKNEAGFWQWDNVTKADGVQAAPQSAATAGGGTTKSTGTSWETKEERAARQVMIVRQSSISSAVNLLGNKAKAADVINTAKEFEAFVMGTEPQSACSDFSDMEDDIPL